MMIDILAWAIVIGEYLLKFLVAIIPPIALMKLALWASKKYGGAFNGKENEMSKHYSREYNPEDYRHKGKNGTTSDKVIHACIENKTEQFKIELSSYCRRMARLIEGLD